jgi:hypothetical protein
MYPTSPKNEGQILRHYVPRPLGCKLQARYQPPAALVGWAPPTTRLLFQLIVGAPVGCAHPDCRIAELIGIT